MFHIRSKEKAVCTVCQQICIVIGSRRRHLIRKDGNHIILMIRRLYCKHCKKIHHELPDFVIPYKRYETDVIEAILDNHTDDVPCEASTIRRLGMWSDPMLKHLQHCIDACRLKYGEEAVPFSLLRPRSDDGTPNSGWLKRAVQLAVNTNHWRTYPVGVPVR